MSWTEIRFDEVTFTEQRKVRCFGCGNRLSRQRTFRARLRPGVSRSDIRMELRVLARQWQPKGVCTPCMNTGQYIMLDDGSVALRLGAA